MLKKIIFKSLGCDYLTHNVVKKTSLSSFIQYVFIGTIIISRPWLWIEIIHNPDNYYRRKQNPSLFANNVL